jgi:hypothetical protein
MPWLPVPMLKGRRVPFSSKLRMPATVGNLAASEAPVFISQLTYRTDQLNVAYQTGLISVATSTGGTASVARSVSEIPSAIDLLVDRIVGHYSWALTVPATTSLKKLYVRLATPNGRHLDYRAEYGIHH